MGANRLLVGGKLVRLITLGAKRQATSNVYRDVVCLLNRSEKEMMAVYV